MEEELRLGEEAANAGNLQAAELHCRQALHLDARSFEARLLAGRVAHYRGDHAAAEAEYRAAAALRPQELAALEGLAGVQGSVNNFDGAAATYRQLLGLAQARGALAKQREVLWRLAEAEERRGGLAAAAERLQQLLALPLDSAEQRLQALCFLADTQSKRESGAQAERLARHLALQQHAQGLAAVQRSMSVARLQVDAERAEEQLREEGSLARTLGEIVRASLPCPRYARFHEAHLQTYLSRMGAFPPRSAARQAARVEALRECVRMITVSAGGCCTPFPFEAAIWLLEEQEELYGGNAPIASDEVARGPHPDRGSRRGSFEVQTQLRWYRGNSICRMSFDKLNIRRLVQERPGGEDLEDGRPLVTKHEAFGVKLAHQFPWTGSAAVALGLALRRRFLSDPDAPSTALRRRQICQALGRGVRAGADSAAGWKALAELQYQNRQWQAAYDACAQALEWHARRRRAGHETLSGFALALRLCAARSLRRLGRLEAAEDAFKGLAGWTTEGGSGFDELSGSPPTSIRQQALRGLAKIALQRGDAGLARAQYERILGKALLGRGQPAEHWAHAEYGWLHFQSGDLATARSHLEKALGAAERSGCAVTDSELAEHRHRLGRVLWALGGAPRTDPRQARAHFEAASLEEGDCQEQACVWLGHWYREVAADLPKARSCYMEALLLDPGDGDAAQQLAAVDCQLGAGRQQALLQPSAFADHSRQAWQEEAASGSDKAASPPPLPAAASSRLSIQSAHSANTELAGFWTLSKAQPGRP